MMSTMCARELLPVWQAQPDSHMGKFFSEKHVGAPRRGFKAMGSPSFDYEARLGI